MSNTKVAIITGGSKGLGKELVVDLVKEGYSIVTTARSNEELNNLKNEISSQFNREIQTLTGDLTKKDDVFAFCEFVKEQYTSIDVIINNAGFNTTKTLTETTEIAEMEKQFAVHAMTPFLIYKSFVAQMKSANHGYIINILSDQVRDRTRGGWAAYSTTKHALYGLGKVMISEAAENGIKVTNAIIGGMNSTFRNEAREEYLLPTDVASVIVQLLKIPKDIFIPEIIIYPKVYLTK
ncbi:MAG: short-chain dehydrogenase/reductase SDR [uncultured bacterium]|uniref:Short-chain dehydrogenase/reductase SDR n=1 Tax=Candidatus Gottesmanbacteria bacterium GW2011_GWB1_43_11 TaxID=1618446 RepID=A0A0G1CNM2_9BACT|nr:MAG: short-chain dehydrogenase/reductase SDR [uncultured bacterium]KKS40112.1 MAG: Short-chain dehydrogenase/reductase SDR [Candidatus Gottesmanbacteria bacterium GW2011_GWA2_42_16]KKS52098.1 MAG: Short-chain dehydrogenase/reductase SDR [Candidatus Gottesmanbacteria bacterium GW2011_GWA1_42_26]KKS81824.1 MAG: short-chain dehydrogenase/reductase SDR [Candidatus Gottesmanbacteria bacterium GW2011_GWC1_43_10]KKS87370.1 MAG: Short-chain dehydrogenase/reductase SDR [Candidatus Gottesmanbacteria b